MTKAVYADNALVVDLVVERKAPQGDRRQPVIKAVPERRSAPQTPPDALEIIAPRVREVARATCNFSFVSAPRGRFQKWYAKLQSLTRLKEGWDSYEAPAPSPEAISAAKGYLATLEMLGWEPTRLEASVMGGVGITHRQGNRKVYVEFYNDGRVHSLFSDRTPNMHTEPVGAEMQSYYRFIRKAREYLHG